MKAKITKKDGTVIELEGSAAELTPLIEREQPPKSEAKPAPFPAVPDTGLAKFLDDLQIAKTGQEQKLPWQMPPYWQPYCPGIGPPPYAEPWWLASNDMCPMGGCHDYPAVWTSVSPASCSKCGKRTLPSPSVTVSSSKQTVPFISSFSVTPPAEPQS